MGSSLTWIFNDDRHWSSDGKLRISFGEARVSPHSISFSYILFDGFRFSLDMTNNQRRICSQCRANVPAARRTRILLNYQSNRSAILLHVKVAGQETRDNPSFRLHETKVFEGFAPKCFNSKRSNLDQIVDTAFILPRGDRDG